MDLESVTLKLPRDLLSGAQRIATARDVTIGHMVRQLLKREVDRQLSAKKSEATGERLLAALQALLARDMAQATGWNDLAERLRPHGYALRPSSGGVALYKTSCGTRVCKGSGLGFSYSTLVKRFGGHMPGHSHPAAYSGIMPAGQIDATRHALLYRHINTARSWPDLINRLAMERMELRMTCGALGIYNATTGRHLCNISDLGMLYTALSDRFGAHYPGENSMPSAEKTDAAESSLGSIARD